MVIKKDIQSLIPNIINHIGLNRLFHTWMTFLTLCLVLCFYAYYRQLDIGLGITGMRDYVSWGIYVSNFVFFIATSLIGMLTGSVLGLLGQQWISPVSRIAELIAFSFASMAGLVIISDMGRPERLLNIFIQGNLHSPLVWDFALLIVYIVITFLLLLIPLIPDMSQLSKEDSMISSWRRKLYLKLSFSWDGSSIQKSIFSKAKKILLITAIPVAFAIHTVTSWLFALNARPGWNSTIFGPYFISGAFVAGVSTMIIVTFILRKACRLEAYIGDLHFDKLGKLLVLVSLVYLYFNINEYFVPAFKTGVTESKLLDEMFHGKFAILFRTAGIAGVILPSILPVFKFFRRKNPLFLLSILVLSGSWLIRYLIIVPSLENPILPIQNVPENFTIYKPSLPEIAITIGPLLMVVMIISVFAKIFPLIPIRTAGKEGDKGI